MTAPNDVWTVDFKSGWHNRSGLPEPIIVRDEFTRFVIAARMLPDSSATTMRSFFDEIFCSKGFPKAICCPQASPFASSRSLLGFTNLSARWLAMGIHLEWKHPGHMRECRWSERPRMPLGYAWRLQNTQERQQELDRWREDFNNTTQPGQKNPPASSFSPPRSASSSTPAGCRSGRLPRERPLACGQVSSFSFPPSAFSSAPLPIVQLDYPGLERRRISRAGYFRFRGSECFLSTALTGWDIALAPREDGHLDVRFAQVSLGTLDPEKVEFTPAIPC